MGRLSKRTYPDNSNDWEGFTYSPAGLIQYTNQLGKLTGYGYDAARRKTSETNANTEILQFTLDVPQLAQESER